MQTTLVFSKAKTGTTTTPKKLEPKTNTTTIAKCNSCQKK